MNRDLPFELLMVVSIFLYAAVALYFTIGAQMSPQYLAAFFGAMLAALLGLTGVFVTLVVNQHRERNKAIGTMLSVHETIRLGLLRAAYIAYRMQQFQDNPDDDLNWYEEFASLDEVAVYRSYVAFAPDLYFLSPTYAKSSVDFLNGLDALSSTARRFEQQYRASDQSREQRVLVSRHLRITFSHAFDLMFRWAKVLNGNCLAACDPLPLSFAELEARFEAANG